MDLKVGDVIDGKYRIVRMLGRGGMGAVYEGEHTRIHRQVAIKVLHARVAENETSVRRFEREAQAAGRIGSDHIVEVFDLGELDDGDHFMVMEYLEGESLKERFGQTGPLSPHEIFPIVIDLLTGLTAAHRAGIIHRDLKPANVFLVNDKKGRHDFVKILDFGVSKFLRLGSEGMEMTGTGTIVGTPYYMSPEQAKADRVLDFRADLFSVGVILYKGLTGRVPFKADTFAQLVLKVVLEDTPSITTIVAGVDPMVAAIVAKATARDPDERYATAELFTRDLQQWLAANPEPSGPPVLLPRVSSVPPSAAPTRQIHQTTEAQTISTGTPGGADGGGVALNTHSSSEPIAEDVELQLAGVPRRRSGLYYGLGAAALCLAIGAAVGVVVMDSSEEQRAQAVGSGAVAASALGSAPTAAVTAADTALAPEPSADPSASAAAPESAPESAPDSGQPQPARTAHSTRGWKRPPPKPTSQARPVASTPPSSKPLATTTQSSADTNVVDGRTFRTKLP